MMPIDIDMNHPEFQANLFALEKSEQLALINTLKKIKKMSWEQLHIDQGLKWETILSRHTKTGNRIYSFRFSKKYRGTALREGNIIRLLALHVDHDSAYC